MTNEHADAFRCIPSRCPRRSRSRATKRRSVGSGAKVARKAKATLARSVISSTQSGQLHSMSSTMDGHTHACLCKHTFQIQKLDARENKRFVQRLRVDAVEPRPL